MRANNPGIFIINFQISISNKKILKMIKKNKQTKKEKKETNAIEKSSFTAR